MEPIAGLAIVAVLLIVAVSAFAEKHGVAAPLLLVVVGIGLSVIPGAPALEIEPEWILTVVLPPLLYAAAVNMPATDFRRDFGAIGALSVLLVIASAFASGAVLYWLLPDLGFAAAVAVGAVISPPDAVAATAIGKRLGLPSRLVTILEGEGLVNDATALVLMRTAVAATAGAVSFGSALGDFAIAVVVGAGVGLIVGIVTVQIRARIDQPVLTTAISFVVPFLAFVPAEELHASGVLAVVVAGLVTGAQSARKFSPGDRIVDRTNWRTIQMLLENGVFLLMGYQMTVLIEDVRHDGFGVWLAVGLGLVATAVLVLARVVFVIPLVAWLRRGERRNAEKAERIEDALGRIDAVNFSHAPERRERVTRFLQRKQADAAFYAREGLGWRGGAVLAWSGMRGVVTLAAAQSLPSDLPYRSQLILVAFTVAVVTLLVQGGTLPAVIRMLGVRGSDAQEAHREFTRLVAELGDAARALLDNPGLRRSDGKPFDAAIVDEVRRRSLAAAPPSGDHEEWTGALPRLEQRRELQRMVLDAEQAALLDARASGIYHSHAIIAAQHAIDNNFAMLEGPSAHG
ncbi:MAG: sodium:proton antiporter [Propioniciclava sp.]|uniref:cation:proton antiporter n=1 Tax=Propioniciclava sp. TaxID=2038686 RepID=UPI0039E473F4